MLPPDAQRANDEALTEELHIIELLQSLSQRDTNVFRRKALRSAVKALRAAFKQP